MAKRLRTLTAAASLAVLMGCATVGGTVVGAGIGSMYGDAEMGAKVGMTAGAVVDIFGR